MYIFINLLTIGWIFAAGKHTDAAASCGLQDIPPDTSAANPYVLPALPDNLPSNTRAWENPTFGILRGVAVEPSAHSPYLTAQFSLSSRKYWMTANARTQNFVKEQKTRTMIRVVKINCNDAPVNSVATYHLKIPIQDMQPPVFAQNEYVFNVTSTWDLNRRPISEGQFVIVSDNAVEYEDYPDKTLRFRASQDILRIKEHPLWVLPYPSSGYYFRLDIYIKDNTELQPGQNFQIFLSALDEYSSGTTKITINVSD